MKFRMARRSGYEVMDVDQFVDQVEEAFAQLTEENSHLRQQVETLQGAAQEPRAEQPFLQPIEPQKQPKPAAGGVEGLVVKTSSEASQAVERLVRMAEKVVAEAEEDAEKIREDARREAHQITTDAKTRAERTESEARVTAERVSADAKSRSEQLERELQSKRSELFGDLEAERDSLTESVTKLRDFEANYRRNLSRHLQDQITSLENNALEPKDRPAVLDADPASRAQLPGRGQVGQPADNQTSPFAQPRQPNQRPNPNGKGNEVAPSNTPRLDALLGER